MRTIEAHIGPAGFDRLRQRYQQTLVANVNSEIASGCVWVAPSHEVATQLREKITFGLSSAVLKPGVFSSQQLAGRVLALSDKLPPRELDRITTRILIREIVERLMRSNQLDFYGQLEPIGALIDLLERELEHAAIHGWDSKRLTKVAKQSGDVRQIEFAAVYQELREAMASHRLIDRSDRWRLAARVLNEKHSQANLWRLAVLAPLDNVAPAEREFLLAVLRAATEATVALDLAPWELDSQEAAAHSVPAWLSDRFDDVKVIEAPAATEESADRSFLREWLFRDPTLAPEPPQQATRIHEAAGVHVLAAQSKQDEFDQVARRVKQHLLDGVAAGDILIATPNPQKDAGRYQETFRRFGVPFASSVPPRLDDSPLVQQLLTLLALPAGNWRFDDVVRVLTSTAQRGIDHLSNPSPGELKGVGFASPRAAAEFSLRRLLVPEGRDTLIDQLRRSIDFLSRRVEERGDTVAMHHRQELVAFQAGLAAVQQLAEALRDLPQQATPVAWFDALRELLGRLGYAALSEGFDSAAAEQDLAALETLEKTLADCERLDRWRNTKTSKWSLQQATDFLLDASSRIRIDDLSGEEGRVRFVSLDQAAGEQPRFLFLTGLPENALPRPAPIGDPVTAATRSTASHQQEEMRLFYRAVTSATHSVCLSYASLDSKAQPLNPCSFVGELQRLFAGRDWQDSSTPSTPMSSADVRRAFVNAVAAGQKHTLPRITSQLTDQRLTDSVLDGLAATLQRSVGDTFGNFEGLLTSEAVVRDFATRFGADHLWSPSQLELYAECPFKFFMRHALNVAPLDPLTVNLDYRRRGSLLHDAMACFHAAVNDPHQLDDVEFAKQFENAVHESSDALPAAPHERSMIRIEAMQAIAWGAAYRQQLLSYEAGFDNFDEPMRPLCFEARFGPSRGETDGDANYSIDEPFQLRLGDEPINITGRVDRIDVGTVAGRTVFNIIDYKTTKSMKVSADETLAGRQLQLMLYAMATQQHLLASQEAAPWQIGYWTVREQGFRQPKQGKQKVAASEKIDDQIQTTEAWQELQTGALEKIRDLVTGIRKAQFPMINANEDCGGRCEFSGVCRVGQARSLGKQLPVIGLAVSSGEANDSTS